MRDLLLLLAPWAAALGVLAVVARSARRKGVPSRSERILRDHLQAEADRHLLLADLHDVFPQEEK